MRITSNTIVADFLSSLSKSRDRINRLNKQLSSGNKLLRVSDDPATANTLLRVKADLSRVASYQSNVVNGTSVLKLTANSLGEISDTLQNVKDALAGASNADTAMLTQVSDQMDSYLALAMDVANTQYDSKYVFGGTATSSAPYVRTGMPQQVTYQGNAESIKYQVGDGITSVVNITGAAAFNSTGKIDLTGVLDNSAAVNTSVTTSVSMTDANGASHAVELKFQKTDANTWAMSAAVPSGATDATLSGGTATLTFDSSTGALSQIVRGAPLVLTPAATGSRAAAPAMTAMISADSLTEGIPSGGSSSVTGTHTAVSVFNKLIELRDKLKAGVEPTADDIAMVSMMQDVVQREEARAGSLSGNLSSAGSYLTAQNTRLLDLQSAKQDADLTEIGLRLKLEQTTLDAALSAAANIIPKSLLDYLT